DPALVVNPLNNWIFTTVSSLLIIAIGWFVTDRIVEPRLRRMEVDGDTSELPKMEPLAAAERRGLRWALLAMLVAGVLFALSLWPETSPWRAPAGAVPEGSHPLLVAAAPVMQSIVALIFVFFLLPGVVYGYIAGTVK